MDLLLPELRGSGTLLHPMPRPLRFLYCQRLRRVSQTEGDAGETSEGGREKEIPVSDGLAFADFASNLWHAT